MGTILLIEGEQTIQGWIQKILPQKGLKIFKAFSPDKEDPLSKKEGRILPGETSALEEAVRDYLKGEVDSGSEGCIHEQIIGKVERALIGIVLEEEQGNQVRAARRLGINRNTLRKKMKHLQITTRIVAR